MGKNGQIFGYFRMDEITINPRNIKINSRGNLCFFKVEILGLFFELDLFLKKVVANCASDPHSTLLMGDSYNSWFIIAKNSIFLVYTYWYKTCTSVTLNVYYWGYDKQLAVIKIDFDQLEIVEDILFGHSSSLDFFLN